MENSDIFIDNGKIRVICSMPVNSLIDFEFSVKPNVHGQAKLKVLLDDTGEATDSILERMHGETVRVVEVSADGNETFPPLFAGIILNCVISHKGGSREADLYAVSGSIYLDTVKKFRSFQEAGISYKEITSDLLKDTPNSALLYFAENKMLEKPVIQYQETDFSFMIRLASYQNTCIYPDTTDSKPRLTYGFPKGKDKGEIFVSGYRMGMDSFYDKKTDKRESLQFYEIKCGNNYSIGDTVWLHQKKLRVCSKRGTLQNGLIYFSYILAADSGIWHEKIYHPLFPGISLKATVLQCQQEYVRLHLDIDPVQEVEKAYPFLWKPETGNMMYCMPEVGTKVYLNIAGREEGEAHAVSCIRLNGTVCPQTQNPKNRVWSNEFGKNIKLYPELLELEGSGKDTSNAILSMSDRNGVAFLTNQTLTVKAEGGVQFRGKKVKLTSSQEFTAVKKDMLSPTVMNLNQTIDILGGKGIITSGGEKELKPLIQSKRIESYDISDIREQILSAIPQGEQEDEMSTVLAASFMSTLYSEK